MVVRPSQYPWHAHWGAFCEHLNTFVHSWYTECSQCANCMCQSHQKLLVAIFQQPARCLTYDKGQFLIASSTWEMLLFCFALDSFMKLWACVENWPQHSCLQVKGKDMICSIQPTPALLEWIWKSFWARFEAVWILLADSTAVAIQAFVPKMKHWPVIILQSRPASVKWVPAPPRDLLSRGRTRIFSEPIPLL